MQKEKKKADPISNSKVDNFMKLHHDIIGNKPILPFELKNKLIEIASNYGDLFEETAPKVLKKLKDLKFEKLNFSPNIYWLLKEDNFYRLESGYYDKPKSSWEIYCEQKGVDKYGN